MFLACRAVLSVFRARRGSAHPPHPPRIRRVLARVCAPGLSTVRGVAGVQWVTISPPGRPWLVVLLGGPGVLPPAVWQCMSSHRRCKAQSLRYCEPICRFCALTTGSPRKPQTTPRAIAPTSHLPGSWSDPRLSIPYGLCEESGEPIGLDRLMAWPSSTRCQEEQALLESMPRRHHA